MYSRLFPIFLSCIWLHQLVGTEATMARLHFEEIGSTQLYSRDHASELVRNPGEWTVITADNQTDGIGFQGRTWASFPSGNIYATFITLFPKDLDNLVDCVIPCSALAAAKTLSDIGVRPEIKWVNDVFVSHKKISGCLCEIIDSEIPGYYYLLVGIGLNVNLTVEELALVPMPATSILAETGHKVDREYLLDSLSVHLRVIVTTLITDGFLPWLNDINELLLYRGAWIEIARRDGTIVSGKLLGLNDEGKLLLRVSASEIISLGHGKIIRVYQ